jgi:hypothetical protein
MGCVYLNSIGLYLDNELTLDERINLEAHIKKCPECEIELCLLKLAGESINGNKIEVDSADFLADLRSRIIKDKRSNQEGKAVINDFGKWSKRFIPLPLVLAFACWLLLLTYINNNNPVEEYIFGKNLSDISNLIDQPGGQFRLGAYLTQHPI